MAVSNPMIFRPLRHSRKEKRKKKTKKKKKTITGGFSLDNKEIGETADAVDVVPHSTSVAI